MKVELKKCFTCRFSFPLSQFNPRHVGSTKLHSSCKVCAAAEAKRRRDRAKLKQATTDRAWPAVDVMENNACNLWHGPVERGIPLRHAA